VSRQPQAPARVVQCRRQTAVVVAPFTAATTADASVTSAPPAFERQM